MSEKSSSWVVDRFGIDMSSWDDIKKLSVCNKSGVALLSRLHEIDKYFPGAYRCLNDKNKSRWECAVYEDKIAELSTRLGIGYETVIDWLSSVIIKVMFYVRCRFNRRDLILNGGFVGDCTPHQVFSLSVAKKMMKRGLTSVKDLCEIILRGDKFFEYSMVFWNPVYEDILDMRNLFEQEIIDIVEYGKENSVTPFRIKKENTQYLEESVARKRSSLEGRLAASGISMEDVVLGNVTVDKYEGVSFTRVYKYVADHRDKFSNKVVTRADFGRRNRMSPLEMKEMFEGAVVDRV